MIIRSTNELEGTDRDRSGAGWRSLRLLRADDAMGFSLHVTTIEAGAEMTLWYKHHVEANLCIEGSGEVVDLATGATHQLSPGVSYSLDRHDRHLVRCRERMQLVCVFAPALTGDETHDADGSYGPPAS